jgi:D-alanyl-lipoteichoic acid acyltransferase DltB (MBOAT superfamily)
MNSEIPNNAEPSDSHNKIFGRVTGFAIIVFQLGLILAAVRLFDVAARNHFFPILCIAVGGYLVHAWLPPRLRAPFFCILSLGTILFVLGWPNGAWVIGIGIALIAICHTPFPMAVRASAIGFTGLFLAGLRLEHDMPFWSVLGSMFMFRIILYLRELRRGTDRPPISHTLAYFFPLPNLCFLFFPIIDFKTFRETYRSNASWEDAQVGIRWIVRGLMHLLLYRTIKCYLLPAPHELVDAPQLMLFLVANYALYLHISGYFHIITGILHLFGFELPRTHHNYFLASSFTDIWRRINIYWKDFTTKVIFYPLFFALRGWGTRKAAMLAALCVFLGTWLLHAYQVFWITGSLPLYGTDAILWLVVGLVVACNLQLDLARVGQSRSSGEGLTLSRAVGNSLKVVGTFSVVCVFWACWNTPPFMTLIGAQAEVGFQGLSGGAWVVGFLGVAVVVYASTQLVTDRLTRFNILPRMDTPIHSVVVCTVALLGLVLAGIPQIVALLGPQVASAINPLRSESATASEAARVVQGYYEEIADAPLRAGSWLGELEGRPQPPQQLHYSDASQPADALLERELIPGWSGELGGRPLTVNRLGMRDRADRTQAKPPNTSRIAVVGSSVVMGYGVGDDETFTRLLEDHLNTQQANGMRYEVLNFGAGRSYAIQRRVLIDRKVFAFHPDAIYYVAHQDEFLGPVRHLAALAEKKNELPYPYLNNIIKKAGITSETSGGMAGALLQPHAREIVLGVYRDLVAECKQRGILPVWIYLPMPGVVSTSTQSKELIQLAEEAGFVVVDLTGWADGRKPLEVRLGESDYHASVLGHQLIAERLKKVLIQRPELLPRIAR